MESMSVGNTDRCNYEVNCSPTDPSRCSVDKDCITTLALCTAFTSHTPNNTIMPKTQTIFWQTKTKITS